MSEERRGTCPMCKKKNVSISRTYFHYEDESFRLQDHCFECEKIVEAPIINGTYPIVKRVDNKYTCLNYALTSKKEYDKGKKTPYLELEGVALKLAEIIDDIDTASDIAKDNLKLYQNLVYKQIKEFRKITTSDGQNIFLKLN